jgi:hypothetical protein
MLHRRWRKRRLDDSSCRCRSWHRRQRGQAGVAGSRLLYPSILLPQQTALLARSKLLQAIGQTGSICRASRFARCHHSSRLFLHRLLFSCGHLSRLAERWLCNSVSFVTAVLDLLTTSISYTMGPVFSLVLDTDINEDLALLYPELYAELTKVSQSGSSESPAYSCLTGSRLVLQNVLRLGCHFHLSRWRHHDSEHAVVRKRIRQYRGNRFHGNYPERARYGRCSLLPGNKSNATQVAVEVTTWHPLMVTAEIATLLIYAASMAFLPQYFGNRSSLYPSVA